MQKSQNGTEKTEVLFQSCEQRPVARLQPLKQIVPGLKVECVPLGIITQFLNLHEVNELGQVNRAWMKKILVVKPNKRSYIDKACSFLVAFHVQKLLCSTSETHPWEVEKLFLLNEIGALFNFTILHSSYVRHFSWNSNATGQITHAKYLELEAQVEAQLKNFIELRSLTLNMSYKYVDESAKTLTQVACHVSNLEYLNINGIMGVSLQYLPPFTVLKELRFTTAFQIHDKHLNALSSLTALQSLSFESSPITGIGLVALGQLTELHTLRFNFCHSIMIAHVAQLAHLTRLQSLHFKCCCSVGDDSLVPLNKFIGLQDLSLSKCKISGPALAQLSGLTALRTLDLSSTGITQVTQESMPQFWINLVNSSTLIIELMSIRDVSNISSSNRDNEDNERNGHRKMWLQHKGKAIKS